MKFLSKLAQIILKGAEIATGLSPIATMAYPGMAAQIGTAVNELNQIAQVVMNVEVFGQVLTTPGADKLKAAAPLVSQIIMQADLLKTKKINDPNLFQQGCTKITDGMADVLNSLDDKVEVEKKVS